MPLLYNNKTQTIENVPDENYTQLVASGEYSPRQKVELTVMSPDGQVGTMPAENAQMAFNQGFRYYGAAESKAKSQADIAQIKQEAYDAPLTAAGLGVARGLTFGLSDVAARGVGTLVGAGDETADALLNLREQNPIASTVGEVTGAVGGAFLPMGPVAAVAGLGSKVAAKAGVGLAELAAKGSAGQIAAEILSKGAGSAIEGAFYATGELMTEAALGDPKLTAANTALNYGVNILGGGLLGGLIPGAATATSKAMAKTGEMMREMNIPEKAMQGYEKLISFFKVSNSEQKIALKEIAKKGGKEDRELIMDLASNPNKATDYAVSAIKEVSDLSKSQADNLDVMRRQGQEKLKEVKYSKSGDQLNEITDITGGLQKAVKTLGDKSGKYVTSAANDLQNVLDDITTKASSAKSLGEMHEVVHEGRKFLDGKFKNLRAAAESGNYEARNTLDVITKARSNLGDFLKSEKTFGKFGVDFATADAAYTELAAATKNFRKAFENKVAVKGGSESQVQLGKSASLIKNPLSDIARIKQASFDAMSNAVESLSKASENLGGEQAALMQETIAGIRKTLNKVQNARGAAILLDRLEAKTGRSLLASGVGAAAGGYMAGDDAAVGGTLGFLGGALLANPKTIMTYLMRLERGNLAAANAAQEASSKLLNIAVPASASGALKALSGVRKQGLVESINRIDIEDHEADKDHVDLFKSRIQPLEQIRNLDDVVQQNMPLFDDIAPETYAQMVNIHSRGIVFLKSKLPPDRDALFAGKTVMSDMQKISLNRSIAAVQNPAELFHEMAEKNIRPETVEAVRTVYPELFAQIQMELSNSLADKKVQNNIDRRTRIELGKILGIPTTEATQNLDLLQQSWEREMKPSQPAASNFKLPSMAPATDAINARMDS